MEGNFSNQNNPNVVVPNPVVPPVQPPSINPLVQSPSSFSPQASVVTPPSGNGIKGLKKIIIILVVLLLIIAAIGATAYFVLNSNSSKDQPVKETVSTISPETLIANFKGENIYYKDIVEVAKEQYSQGAIDSQALKDALNILTERKILDAEKIEKNIVVSPEEIKAKQDADSISEKQAYYEVLKEKTTKIEAKSWEVYVIGFWVPPTSDQANLTVEEKQTTSNQLQDGLKALTEAEPLLKTDQTPIDIASSIITKYPSLGTILGVNGYLVTQAKEAGELTNLTTPKVYTYESGNKDQPFYAAIYSLVTPGEVKLAISSDNSGANLVKLVSSSTQSSFNSYEEWLSNKRTSFLQVVYSL